MTNPYRLSHDVEPTAYRLSITPNLDDFTFAGRVVIDLEVHQASNALTLHAFNLDLERVSVRAGDVNATGPAVEFDETYQTATLTFDETIPAGAATLEIDYSGRISDGLLGFYRSTYTDPEGTEHLIATTQLENVYARQAFPCWDEPNFKAVFELDVTIPSDLEVFSNTHATSDEVLADGSRRVGFAPTMKMSTYLLAWVIGPFEVSEVLDVDGTPLRVVTPRGKGHLGGFALEAGAFCLRWFNDYFGVRYPGDKLDLVAIPDFSQGAMENVGCITFREVLLLVDPSASQSERERVAMVIAHEIAHQWFGNLVTMDWWQGIWLNEAFASFMATVVLDAFRPDWNVWVSENNMRHSSMENDETASTRAIEYEVISPDDINGMFDSITYTKGAAVLRMLQGYLGEDVFREGMRHYVATHSYANTVTTDLWDALEHASGQPVRELMDTWILQGGHPLVTLEGGVVNQEPCRYAPATPDSKIGADWIVPVLTRSTSSDEPSRHLLHREPVAIDDAAPVVLNAGGWGYYRSRYGRAELHALLPHLDRLNALERANLVTDTWINLFTSHYDLDQFLSVLENLGDHDVASIWEMFAQSLDMIARPLDDAQRARLAARVAPHYRRQLARLGWERRDGEGDLVARARAAIIRVLGRICRDPEVVAEARRRFESGDVDADLLDVVLRIVADQGRVEDFETFLQRERTAETPQQETRYRFALGAFPSPALARRAAELCLSEFRAQDGDITLGVYQMNAHEEAAREVWRYCVEHWEDAKSRFNDTVVYLTLGLPSMISDAGFADEVAEHLATHPLPAGNISPSRQLELMRAGVTFAQAIKRQF